MKTLKVLLMVLGALTGMVVLAGAAGSYYIYKAVEDTPQLSAADIEIGGAVPAAERAELINACTNATSMQSECTCLEAKANEAMSRVDRIMLTSIYESNLTKAVAAGAAIGTADLKLTDEQLELLLTQWVERSAPAIKACGLPIAQ